MKRRTCTTFARCGTTLLAVLILSLDGAEESLLTDEEKKAKSADCIELATLLQSDWQTVAFGISILEASRKTPTEQVVRLLRGTDHIEWESEQKAPSSSSILRGTLTFYEFDQIRDRCLLPCVRRMAVNYLKGEYWQGLPAEEPCTIHIFASSGRDPNRSGLLACDFRSVRGEMPDFISALRLFRQGQNN